MHIADGILSPAVLSIGTCGAAAGTIYGICKLKYEQIPRAAFLASAFFVASLIHIPIGPSSAHLILNGLVGLILGSAAFPVILTGLTLQAFFFGFGGVTVLGINTFNMALPAMICCFLFRIPIKNSKSSAAVFALGFLTGAFSVLLSCLMVSFSLFFSDENFFTPVLLLSGAHIPVILIEGIITGFAAVFLKKAKPELFDNGF